MRSNRVYQISKTLARKISSRDKLRNKKSKMNLFRIKTKWWMIILLSILFGSLVVLLEILLIK